MSLSERLQRRSFATGTARKCWGVVHVKAPEDVLLSWAQEGKLGVTKSRLLGTVERGKALEGESVNNRLQRNSLAT